MAGRESSIYTPFPSVFRPPAPNVFNVVAVYTAAGLFRSSEHLCSTSSRGSVEQQIDGINKHGDHRERYLILNRYLWSLCLCRNFVVNGLQWRQTESRKI